MPKLQDIEQFKVSLKGLGKEPETLGRWGETWSDTKPPESAVSDDFAALLQAEEPVATVSDQGGPAAADTDFASFLDGLSLEEPTESAPEPSFADEPDDFSVPSSLLEGLDLGSEQDTAEPEPLSDLEEPSDLEEAPELEEPSGFEAPTEPQPVDAFEIPADLAEPATDEAPEPAESAEAAGSAEATESFGLEDLDSLASEAPGASGADMFDDFSIPDSIDEGAETPEEDDRLGSGASDTGDSGESGESIEIGESIEPGEPAESTETPAADAFDQFDLGEIPDLGADTFGAEPGAGNLGGELAPLGGESGAADNFALDSSWGSDFTIPGFEMGTEVKPEAAKPAKAKATPSPELRADREPRPSEEHPVREVQLTDEQVDALQDALLSYPLNLRLAVEDIIANSKGSDAQQSELIWMLVEGKNVRDVARLAGKILKRYIEIPAGFIKRSGAALEAEKGSLRYVFMHSILPVLQILVLVAAGAAALFYVGYNFGYKPLKAYSLYANGARQIGLAKYGESMESFDRADKLWPMKSWYYRYAEGFASNSQYPRAETMYGRLLQRWPRETKAALDWARMESSDSVLAFDQAEKILNTYILGRDYFNKDALLLSARNYLNWADAEEQRYEGPDTKLLGTLYEKARLQLATLMERHGRSDGYLELMLLYFIRTERSGGVDELKEVRPLAKYFTENKKSAWSAATLAELGEYLLDRNETEYVNGILLAAVDRDGTLPEAHVAMARWNRRAGFPKDELKALEYAARFFAEAEKRGPISVRRTKKYIEAMMRLGELCRADGRSLDAEDAFNIAIDQYERSLQGRRFKPDARYGRAYSLLADIYYSDRMDFPGALALYAKAEANGYTSPRTDYHRGYMLYMQPPDDGSTALRYFYRAGLDADASPYLLWATANALYARADYFAAQGYYTMLTNTLQFQLDTLAQPSPQTKPSHGEIVQLLMMSRNNLGAALYRVAERMGDARRRSDAMLEFTESARLFDSLSRDQLTMIRSETKNLGFLNLDFVLHPMRGIDIATYRTIPTEMDYPQK